MKTLKPSPRPFIALGTLSGMVFAVAIIIGWPPGSFHDFAPALVAFLPLLLLIPISFVRVEIDDEEIRVRKFGKTRRVQFEQIGYSYVSVLAERDHPVSVTIFAKKEELDDEDQGSGETELMTVGLKVLCKEDVIWLLSLPQLRILGRKR